MSEPAGPTDSPEMTWRLAADDVEITTRPVRTGSGPPMLEVTLMNTALDVPAFSFVMCPDDLRETCARGLQLGWLLEHDPHFDPDTVMRLVI